MSQPFEDEERVLSIDELRSIVDSHDFDTFFQLVETNLFLYLSDINFTALYDLYQRIPPIVLEKEACAIGALSMACFYKGYHQEARKWSYFALHLGIVNEELAVRLEYVVNVIDYVYGYKSQKDFLIDLELIEKKSSKNMKLVSKLQKLRIEYYDKEEEARKYGRYRQFEVIENIVEKLVQLCEGSLADCDHQILLEIALHYTTLIPYIWSEIVAKPQFHNKVGLDVSASNLLDLMKIAEKKTTECDSVFDALINHAETGRGSLYSKAEALLLYGMYKYSYQMLEFVNLVFEKDSGALASNVPLTGRQKEYVEQSLSYFSEAVKLFELLGVEDRKLVALIQMLACYEDLKNEREYRKTKDKIDAKIKTVLVPNTLKLYDEIIKEGSLRTRQIKGIREQKSSDDFRKANMDDVSIEMQVDCCCKSLDIFDKNRIENVRKDVVSYVLAAKYRINVCKHFELLQDMKHTFSRNTLYAVDPNRKGLCKMFGFETRIVQSDPEIVINSFYNEFCKNCLSKERLTKNTDQ